MLNTTRYLRHLLTLMFFLFFLFPHAASSSEQLAREIDKAIRTAEKSTFSGDYQEAASIMKEVTIKLEELKTTDPRNRKLRAIILKYDQLQKKVDRKLNVSHAATPAAKAESKKVVQAPPVGGDASAQTISGVAAIALNGMIGHLDRAEKSMQSGTGDLGKTSLRRAADKYKELEKRFADLLTLPEVTGAKERLGELLVRVDQATADQAAAKERLKADTEEQNVLITQWRNTLRAYNMPGTEKYLPHHPELIEEAKNTLSDFEKAPFPLGTPPELQDSVKDLRDNIDRAMAEKGAATIDDRWLPRIRPLITSNDPAYLSPSGPAFSQPEEVARMDASLATGKQLLDEYDKEFAGGESTHFLGQAVTDLRRSVEGYEQSRAQSLERLIGELREKIDRHLKQFTKNSGWTAQSGTAIHIVNKSDMTEIGNKLEGLKQIPGVPTEIMANLEQDVSTLRDQDIKWRGEKTAFENAPKPFPAAGMTSKSLEKEMLNILNDRGIGAVDKLVIVDKDWWVQRGEFRYIKAAALQKDDEGPYFTYVTFKQMATLAGYGPTELWEQGRKNKLAK